MLVLTHLLRPYRRLALEVRLLAVELGAPLNMPLMKLARKMQEIADEIEQSVHRTSNDRNE
jgi:hypothetical protein